MIEDVQFVGGYSVQNTLTVGTVRKNARKKEGD